MDKNKLKKNILKPFIFWIPFPKLRRKIRFYLYNKFNIKHQTSQKSHISDFYYNNPNIFPEATGYLRDIQNAQVKILKEVHRICENFNIKYWLSFGSLIGAVRNGKFISWDDDIDISMLRDDYKKFVKIFNKNTKYKNIYAYYTNIGLIKVQLKETKVTLDIFCCDIIYKNMKLSEKLDFTYKIYKTSNVYKYLNSKNNTDEYNDSFEKYTYNILLKKDKVSDLTHSSIFYSIDFSHYLFNHKCMVFDYNTIFPLKKVKFENCEFYAPNDMDTYLTYIYGNYLSTPIQIQKLHTDISKLTLEEVFNIKNFNNDVN